MARVRVGWDGFGSGGEGAEVGGAGGVVGGADAEVEVDGEEEVQLQRVELREGEATDLRPAMQNPGRIVFK